MWNKKNINQGVVESDEVEAESLDFSEEPLLHVSDEEIPGESPKIDEVNSSSHSVADNIPEELLPEDPAARERVIQVLNDPAAMRKIAAALEDLRKEYQLEYIFSKTGLAAISAARLSQDEKKLQLAVEAEAEIGSEFDISKLDEDDKDQDLSFSDEEREEAISFAKALGLLGREEGGESPGVAEPSEHVEPSEGGPLSEPEGPSVPSESSEPEGPSVPSESSEPEGPSVPSESSEPEGPSVPSESSEPEGPSVPPESSEPEAEQAHKASLKEKIIHLHKKNLVLMIIIEVAVVAALAGGIWQIQQTREHQKWLEADAKKTASAVTAAKGPVLENGYNQLVVKADAEINNARVENLRRRAAAMERIPEERSTDIENSETYRIVQSAYYFNGPHLSSGRGSVTGPNGRETYYNLNMSGVVNIMHSAGFSGTYWVRSDGVKMFGNYVMVAANYGVHPKGSIVKSSLGLAIVVDTGGFASSNPQQLDLATAW
ncbi:hypothetical protein FYJ66_03415 [Clostridiales Family XIII bacterium RF-744-FAT-WT-3]|uniref:Uncharacterized protein n=1 Tax=Baileyella intestinalis TaxID=2606709 RepID=A0A6A8M8S8_9FIRM|nr:hypothetical protein [Baileyella intestinalis]MST68639.1 hypothetical protein [Baileyella intestinalis]